MLRLMVFWSFGAFAAAASVGADQVRAELLLGRDGYLPGRPLQAGIRLVVEPGWHCCWINPGAGGTKLRAVWELPAGWRAGELGYPVPQRFQSGGLPRLGYTGEVILPVGIEVPKSASGEARIKLRLSWSVCNVDGCAPGSMEIPLVLPQGGAATRDAITIGRAVEKVPRALIGARLAVTPMGEHWQLALRLPERRQVDLSKSDVFPVTTGMIDPAAEVSFVLKQEQWIALAPRSAWGGGAGKRVKLVLAGGSLPFPVTVEGRVGS